MLMASTLHAGDMIATIPSAAGLEFAADDISLAYTVPDAAGRPYQVCSVHESIRLKHS